MGFAPFGGVDFAVEASAVDATLVGVILVSPLSLVELLLAEDSLLGKSPRDHSIRRSRNQSFAAGVTNAWGGSLVRPVPAGSVCRT